MYYVPSILLRALQTFNLHNNSDGHLSDTSKAILQKRFKRGNLPGITEIARVRGRSPIHNYFLLKPKFFQPFPATYLCGVKSHMPTLLGQSICTNYSEFFSMGDLFLQPHLLILNSASMVGSFWIHCSVFFFLFFLNSSYYFPHRLFGVSPTHLRFRWQLKTEVAWICSFGGLSLWPLSFWDFPHSISKRFDRPSIHSLTHQTNIMTAFCTSSLWNALAYHIGRELPSTVKLNKWISSSVIPVLQQIPSSFCLILVIFQYLPIVNFSPILSRV